MTAVPETLLHYLAAWNEGDLDRIRPHLDRAAAENVLFVDPLNITRGLDQLEGMIRTARADRPTAEFHLASGVDGHNGRYRYRWEIQDGDQVIVRGMDVTTLDAAGRIERVDGFFGDFVPRSSP